MKINDNKRYINARPIFLFFIGMIIGIILIFKFFELKMLNYFNYIYVFYVVLLLIVIVWMALFLTKKDTLFFEIIKRDFKYLTIFILAIIVGTTSIYSSLNRYYNLKAYQNYECELVGTIEKVYNYGLLINNIIVDGEELNSGAVATCNFSTNYFEEGMIIKVLCKISLKSLNSSNNIKKYVANNAYEVQIDDNSDIEILSETTNKLSENIRLYVKNILFIDTNADNAGLFYAMIFGDKELITEENETSFSAVGISHILAVSGLHIGVLVAFLYYILTKILKQKKILKIIILCLFLLFYSYVCGFTSSVVRASIMAITLVVSKEFGYRYDALNSLSLAGIIILLLFPASLFGTGFQLSFLCVFSIISFSPFVTKCLMKIKVPKTFSQALSISISTNLAIFVICSNIFHQISLISVLCNLIVIPLFSILFVMLFVSTLLVSIFNFLSFVFIVPETLLHALKLVANFFADLPVSYITLFNISYLVLLITILIMFFTQFLMCKKNIKSIICFCLTFICFISVVMSNIPRISFESRFTFTEFSSNNICLYEYDGKANIIGFNRQKYNYENLLIKNRIKKIDTVVAYNFEFNQLKEMQVFAKKYNINRIIFPSCCEPLKNELKFENVEVCFMSSKIIVGAYTLTEITDYDSKCLAIHMDDSENDVLYINSLLIDDFAFLCSEIEDEIDYCFIPEYAYQFEDYNLKVDSIICNSTQFDDEKIFNLFNLENFTLKP